MCENQSGFRDIQVGELLSCQMSSSFDDLDFFPSEWWDLMTRWRPSMNQWAWVWHGFQIYLERWSNLTHMFQTFWNHHLVSCSKLKQPPSPMLEHNHINVDKEADWRFRFMHRKITWIQIWELVSSDTGSEQKEWLILTNSVVHQHLHHQSQGNFLLGLQKNDRQNITRFSQAFFLKSCLGSPCNSWLLKPRIASNVPFIVFLLEIGKRKRGIDLTSISAVTQRPKRIHIAGEWDDLWTPCSPLLRLLRPHENMISCCEGVRLRRGCLKGHEICIFAAGDSNSWWCFHILQLFTRMPWQKNKKGTFKHGWYDADTSYLTGTQLNKLYSQRCQPT